MTIQQIPISSAFFNPPGTITINGANTASYYHSHFITGSTTFGNWGAASMPNGDTIGTASTFNGAVPVRFGMSGNSDFVSFGYDAQLTVANNTYRHLVTARSRYIDVYAWGAGGGSGGTNDTAGVTTAASGGGGSFGYTRLVVGTHVQPGEYLYCLPGLAGSGGWGQWWGGSGGAASVVWKSTQALKLGAGIIGQTLFTSDATAISNSFVLGNIIMIIGGGGGGGGHNCTVAGATPGAGGGAGSGGAASNQQVNSGGGGASSTGHGAAPAFGFSILAGRRGPAYGGGWITATTRNGEAAFANIWGNGCYIFANATDYAATTYLGNMGAGGGVFQGGAGGFYNCATATTPPGDSNGDAVANNYDFVNGGGGGGGSQIYIGINAFYQYPGLTSTPSNSGSSAGYGYGGVGKGINSGTNYAGKGGTPGRIVLIFSGA